MASPSIGGVAFGTFQPNHQKAGGNYKFHRQEQGVSGNGTSYFAGEQWAEWNWAALTPTEYAWLVTQWATGPTAFELWTDDVKATAKAFTSGTMLYPKYDGLSKNHYLNVHVEFRYLMPLV